MEEVHRLNNVSKGSNSSQHFIPAMVVKGVPIVPQSVELTPTNDLLREVMNFLEGECKDLRASLSALTTMIKNYLADDCYIICYNPVDKNWAGDRVFTHWLEDQIIKDSFAKSSDRTMVGYDRESKKSYLVMLLSEIDASDEAESIYLLAIRQRRLFYYEDLICLKAATRMIICSNLHATRGFPLCDLLRRPSPDTLSQLHPMRIMIVEDSIFNQQILMKTLNKLGYMDVITAKDGQEGLNTYIRLHKLNRPIEFIFMDVDMPILDGFSASLQIRHFGLKKKVAGKAGPHIVAFTADNLTEDQKACLRSGMCIFAGKPLNITKLEILIKEGHDTIMGKRKCRCTAQLLLEW